MTDTKERRIAVRLDEKDVARLEYLATATGIRSDSDLVRLALTRLEQAERAREKAAEEPPR